MPANHRLPVVVTAAALLLSCLLPATAAQAGASTAAVAGPTVGTYAVLGDSYISGEGTGRYTPDTAIATNNCHRSKLSDAVLAQAVEHPTTTLEFGACSGARIEDFYYPFNQNGSKLVDGRVTNSTEGPQLSHLSPQTQVVVLSVGGNDIGFGPVLTYCASRSPQAQTCQSKYGALVKSGITALKADSGSTSLSELYRNIELEAPGAEVYVMGYPRLFPATVPATPCRTGGPVKVGKYYQFGNPAYFRGSDMMWMNDSTKQLNEVIRARASAAGFTYVDNDEALAGHDVCATSNWVTRVTVTSGRTVAKDWVVQQSFHPNAAGHAALAKSLEATMP